LMETMALRLALVLCFFCLTFQSALATNRYYNTYLSYGTVSA
jgi:hypothetical protein